MEKIKEKELIAEAEKWLIDTYGKNNFAMWKAPHFRHMNWDIFGVFDLVVAIEFEKLKPVMFIQITTLPNISTRRKKIRAFFDNTHVFIPNCWLFGWDKKKGKFKIEKVP